MELGKFQHHIEVLLVDLNTPSSWLEAEKDFRAFILQLNPEAMAQARSLMVFLWEDGDPTRNEIGINPAHHDIFVFQVEATITNLVTLWQNPPLRAFGPPASTSVFGGGPPSTYNPSNVLGIRPQVLRKAPCWATYDPEEPWEFLFSTSRDIMACQDADGALSLVAALMAGKDNGFLTTDEFIHAVTPEEVVGAMMMECEGVESMAQLQVRVFSVKRQTGESLLKFVDRINPRHLLFVEAFPRQPRQDAVLLAHVKDAVLEEEWGVNIVLESVSNLSEFRKKIRGLGMGGSRRGRSRRMQTSPRSTDPILLVEPAPVGGKDKENWEDTSKDTRNWVEMQQAIAGLTLKLDGLTHRNRDRPPPRRPPGVPVVPLAPRNPRACFRCGGLDHLVAQCPHPVPEVVVTPPARATAAVAPPALVAAVAAQPARVNAS